MAITRLGGANAISGTIPVSVGGTGVTSADDIGNLVKLNSASLSGESEVIFEFTGDYKVYKVMFYNLHSSGDVQDFRVNFSTDGTNFNTVKVQSGFKSARNEAGTVHQLVEDGSMVGNNTSTSTVIAENLGTDNDQTCFGELIIGNPKSTTYTKNYRSVATVTEASNYTRTDTCGGYVNVLGAVTHIRFDLTGSANFDDGEFILYGIKT